MFEGHVVMSHVARDASVSAGKHATGAKPENTTTQARENLRKPSLDRVSFAHDWLKN